MLSLKSVHCSLIEFLRHVTTKDGLSAADVQVSAVCNWKIPKTARDVKGFFSLASFYQQFIMLFVKISEPSTSLMKKGHVFIGTEAYYSLFDQIKEYLCSEPML